MTEFGFTDGFGRILAHSGPRVPEWQVNLIGRIFSVVYPTEAWLVRLREGESVTWETAPVKRFDALGRALVVIAMGMGLGPDGYMTSGEFVLSVNDEPVLDFRAVKYSAFWKQDDVRFYFEVKRKVTTPETAVCGLGYLLLPPRLVGAYDQPLRLSITNRKKSYTRRNNSPYSDRWVRVDRSYPLAGRVYLEGGIAAVRAGPERAEWEGRGLYFGDLHAHSGRLESLYEQGEREFLRDGIGLNCGVMDPEDYHRYAKHAAQLDFFCVTDHHRDADWGLTQADWRYRVDTVRRWHADDFACFVGCELVTWEAGHWNLYFRDPEPTYPPAENRPFAETKRLLKQRTDRFMVVPHQVPTFCGCPMDWDYFDQELSPLVEIYSHWGSGEYYGNPLQCREVDVHPDRFVDEALRRGYRLGFIGSTDEHGGAPGDATTFFNPVGAGLACVWAPGLSREQIFDALEDRYCYATTGARIVLKFGVNGEAMGRQNAPPAAGQRNRIYLEVDAPERVQEIVIVRDGQEAAVKPCRSARAQWEWVDESPGKHGFSFYYPRVILDDGETAWGSPVWVEPPRT